MGGRGRGSSRCWSEPLDMRTKWSRRYGKRPGGEESETADSVSRFPSVSVCREWPLLLPSVRFGQVLAPPGIPASARGQAQRGWESADHVPHGASPRVRAPRRKRRWRSRHGRRYAGPIWGERLSSRRRSGNPRTQTVQGFGKTKRVLVRGALRLDGAEAPEPLIVVAAARMSHGP